MTNNPIPSNPKLRAFCDGVLTKGQTFSPQALSPRLGQAEIYLTLHQQTAQFARAFQRKAGAEIINPLAQAVEGSLLVCESMQLMTTAEVEALLDELHDLLEV